MSAVRYTRRSPDRSDVEGAVASYALPVTELRLTHPRLHFYVDVTVHERGGRFMATADLAEDSRDLGVGETPQEAVRVALRSLGEPYATEMAEAALDGSA